MARKKKPRTIRVKDPERAKAIRRMVINCVAVVVLAGLLGAGLYRIKKYVEFDLTFPDRPPRVVLKNRPAWMSDALAMQIVNSVRPWGVYSAFDRRLLIDTASILSANPWVKKVKEVRRAYGQKPADTLEIDCEFRAPVALVHWKDYYWLIDGEQVKLPEQFTAQQLPAVINSGNKPLNIRVIEGVTKPPVESGQKWPGDDLAAGLELAKLLFGQNFADEIVTIDVSNFGGRVDGAQPHLILVTRYNTKIYWGRPVSAKDFFVEVPTAQKLKNLQQIFRRYGRIDANQPWIDIRFDRITYPSGQTTASLDPPH